MADDIQILKTEIMAFLSDGQPRLRQEINAHVLRLAETRGDPEFTRAALKGGLRRKVSLAVLELYNDWAVAVTVKGIRILEAAQ